MRERLGESIYWDPRHYEAHNAALTERDLPFLLRRAAEYGGPILELACGAGRLGVPLAAAGYQVVGLDLTPSLLEYSAERAREEGVAERLELIEADVRRFDLGRRLPLIAYPFNAVTHLHDYRDVLDCFGRVRAHLAPDGRFLLDLLNPKITDFARDPDEFHREHSYPNPDGDGEVVVWESSRYDRATQVNHITWRYDIGDRRGVFERKLTMRQFYPQELRALLECAGLTIERLWGDYDDSPFTSESPKQLVLCAAKHE